MKYGALIGVLGVCLMLLSSFIGVFIHYNSLNEFFMHREQELFYKEFLSSFFLSHLPEMIMAIALFAFCFTFYNQIAKKDGRNK